MASSDLVFLAGLVVSQVAGGITLPATYRMMPETAGRVARQMTPSAVRLTPDRIPCQTTDQRLRRVTSQTALQTVYDTTLGTMYDTALPTKDQTTVQITPQTIRWVIPQAGVSSWLAKA